MKILRDVFCVAAYNIKKWTNNYRVWFIALYVPYFAYYCTQNIPAACSSAGEKIGPWLLPMITSSYGLTYFLIAQLLLFCDAPFLDRTQPYLIMRCKRKIWAVGQLAYITIASLLYSLYVSLMTIIVNLSCIEFTRGWGAFLENQNARDYLRAANSGFQISEEIMTHFTPAQAMWFSFLMLWLAGILIGLTMFCVNSISASRITGIAVTAIEIVFVFISGVRPVCVMFSPLSWVSLTNIRIEADKTYLPAFSFVIAVYLLLFAIFIAIIMVHNRKRTIEVLPPI